MIVPCTFLFCALVGTLLTVGDITVKTAESVVAGVVELGAVGQVSGEGVGVGCPTGTIFVVAVELLHLLWPLAEEIITFWTPHGRVSRHGGQFITVFLSTVFSVV